MPTIEQYEKELNTIRNNALALIDLSMRIDEEIKLAKDQLEKFSKLSDESTINNTVFNSGIETGAFFRIAHQELVAAAQKAVTQVSKEYNNIFFIQPFMNAINSSASNPEFIKIERMGEGIKVFYDMNMILGRLEDYAAGVKKARQEMRKVKTGKVSPPAQALKFWKEKYYGAAREGKSVSVWRADPATKYKSRKQLAGGEHKRVKVDKTGEFIAAYWKTMNLRIQNAKGPAPWWELLDKGNLGAKMGSSGTEPYPIQPATRFTQLAALQAQQRIEADWGAKRSNLRTARTNNTAYLQQTVTNLEGLYNKIVSKITETNLPSAISIVDEQLKQFGRERFANEELEKEIAKALLGENVPSRITIRTGGISVRIRTRAARAKLGLLP